MNVSKTIEDIDRWLLFKMSLVESRYKLWQTQYHSDCPEGFCARFMNDKHNVEIITHNPQIERDISSSTFAK